MHIQLALGDPCGMYWLYSVYNGFMKDIASYIIQLVGSLPVVVVKELLILPLVDL